MQNTTVDYIINNAKLGTDAAFVAKRLEHRPTVEAINALVTVEQVKNMNQKAIKRTVQAVAFMVSGNVAQFDKITATVISALILAKSDTVQFSQLHALNGLHKEGQNNDHIKGVSKSKLNKFLGIGETAGTITSKVSRSVGKGGFLTAMGLVRKSDKHSVTIDRDALNANRFCIGYAVALSSMTDGAFALVKGQSEE